MPRSVPPRHWYDDRRLEHGHAPGSPERGELDRRARTGPAGPGGPETPYQGGPAGDGQQASYGPGPGDYQPDAPYQGEPADYGQDTRYRRSPGDYAQTDPYGYYGPGATNGPGPGGYHQDPRYQDPGYQGGPAGHGQDPGYQGGSPGDFGQEPPDGQHRGGADQHASHRHGKRGQAGARWPRLLRRLLSHRSVQAVLVALVIFFGWVGWSVGQALTAPGNGSTSTRLAEWARDHYLGPVVTLGEWLTYQAPKVGGKPRVLAGGPRRPGPARPRPGPVAGSRRTFPRSSRRPPGRPWPVRGSGGRSASVNGVPAIYGTYLRPDGVHTSYVAGIASMDQRLLSFQLRPGAEDPGPGNWGFAPWLPPNSRTGLLATFNGGFKMDSAGGGFYLNGHTKGVLTNGAASLVYYRNGRMTIGDWGHGVGMSSDVLGVRQNLKLIVDHGAVPASVDQNVQGQWGATLGGGYYVWRSGIGITRDGRVIFVYGPALSVRTLANLLQRAGAVEGMQMDINPAWMSYMYYKPTPSTSDPTPVNLLPNQPEPANRYYSVNSRDFTAVFAR